MIFSKRANTFKKDQKD